MATHVPIHWLVPVGRSVEIALFGGPTVFQVRQDLVSGIAFEQRYAYTAATATGAQTRERSGMATGYHAGAEVAFYFSDQVGVGGTVRFSRARLDLGSGDAIEAGGLQTSGGLRLRF